MYHATEPYLSALSGEHYEHHDRFLINIVHEYNVGNPLQGGVLLKKDNFLASSTFSTHAVFKIKVKLTLRRKMLGEESKKQVFTREIIFG